MSKTTEIKCLKVKLNPKTHRMETAKGATVEDWATVQKNAVNGVRKIRDEAPNSPWEALYFVDRNYHYYVGMTPHHPDVKAEMKARNAEAKADPEAFKKKHSKKSTAKKAAEPKK